MSKKLFGRVPYKWIYIAMWSIAVIGTIIVGALFKFVADTKMPNTEELENPTFEESSIVFSDDLVEIDRYFQLNRQWVRHEDLSQHLIDALIATEDHRFHGHSGIDAKGTARAFAFFGTRGGASTITQQLAKQFFTPERSRNPIKRVWQKMKEWVIAVEFERRYTKGEIIAMFLNKFDFYYLANGVASASKVYFGKEQKQLTVSEAAILVGMLKNPYYFNPVKFPERALNRRNTVLGQMYRNAFLSDEEYRQHLAEPIDVSQFNKGENYKGLAPYFMSELKKYIKNLMVTEGIVKPGGESYNLDTDGLEIFTTIDTRYQKHAEDAMKKHMIAQQKTFERVWKDRDPWTYIDPTSDLTTEEAERQLNIRDGNLSAQVEKTELFQNLKFQFLNDVIVSISEDIPKARLWEGDIKRLLRAEKDEDYLSELIDIDYINKEQRDTYLEILNSKEYPILKSQWKKLQSAVKRAANTPRMMTLYSHEGPIEREMTVIDSLKYMNQFLQLGSVSIEPQTGYVRTWVGGTNYNVWKYDHVTSNRQVGSTFKPFLYTAALNNGISPCHKIRDMQYTIPAGDHFQLTRPWSPQNSRGEFTDEEITLKEALKESLNSASVWLVKQLESVQPIISIAERMGIGKGKVPKYPSIVLGSPELSVLEMTAAYATFANQGRTTKPIFIKRIEHDGVVIYESTIEQSRALPEDVNSAMVELLKFASSNHRYALKTDWGGKTGTTNLHVDGWFMGITPNLVTGTWVGGDLPWVRYLALDQGQGGRMARPFFIDYMKRVEADEDINFETDARFVFPEDMSITVDCSLYEPLYQKKDSVSDEFDEFEDALDELEGED